MNGLPDDVLILVCQYLTIPDVFALRLSSRRLATLISVGGSAIAKGVATNTFPDHNLLLRCPKGGTADFTYLRDLLPKFIAAVLVDCFRIRSPFLSMNELGFPAEAQEGDIVRAEVERGVKVWNELCLISRSAYCFPPSPPDLAPKATLSLKDKMKRVFARKSIHDDAAQEITAPQDDELATLKQREEEIASRRSIYVRSLSSSDIANFRFTYALLNASIYTNHDAQSIATCNLGGPPPPYRGPDHFDWAGSDEHRIEDGTSWMNWFIAHRGPAVFFRQWWAEIENHVRDEALQAWKTRSAEQVQIERSAWLQVQQALDERDQTGFERSVYHPISANVHAPFEDYAFKRADQIRQGIKGPREILKDIPFVTDFRVTEKGKTLPGLYGHNYIHMDKE